MTNQTLLIALTRRALETQLKRSGSPKKEAMAVVARLPHAEQWRKLPLHVRAEIAWKAATSDK